MKLNKEHLLRCIQSLEQAFLFLEKAAPDSIEYEIYRNATVKGFELSLETAGKLLRKTLKEYFAVPLEVDQLTYKDVLRHATKHGILTDVEVKRWFRYRENRNNTAHDYGIGFARETLLLLPDFIRDIKQLEQKL